MNYSSSPSNYSQLNYLHPFIEVRFTGADRSRNRPEWHHMMPPICDISKQRFYMYVFIICNFNYCLQNAAKLQRPVMV